MQMSQNNKTQQLIKQTINMYNNFNPKQSFKQQLIKLPNFLKSLDVPFVPQKYVKGIGVRTLFTHQNLRISIYYIPFNITMKLHNHPKMNVLTHILSGSMKAQVFNPSPKRSGLYSRRQANLGKGMKITTEPSVNNLHEFTGRENGCTFLDIVFPDYNLTDRPCQFFDFKQGEMVEGEQLYTLIKLGDDYYDSMEQV